MPKSQQIKEYIQPFPGGPTEYLERPEFEVFYGGETGSAKTWSLVVDALGCQYQYTPLGKPAYQVPGYRAVIFRRKTTQLNKLIDEGKKIYTGLGGDYVSRRVGDPGPSFTFPPDGRIFLCHMESEDNKRDHDSIEYQFVGFDELTHFTLTQYLYMPSRLRSTITHLNVRLRATGMPMGTGLWWVKKRFDVKNPGVSKCYRMEGDPEKNPRGIECEADHPDARSRVYILGQLSDNKAVNQDEYRRNVKGMGSKFAQALLKHDWDAFSGDFFDTFDASMIIDPFPIPAEWELICPIDPGWSSPCSASLLSQDFNGCIYRIATYYEEKRNPEQNAIGIWDMIKTNKYTNGRMPSMFPSGHDAFAHKDRHAIIASSKTFADVFLDQGMVLTKAVTDRKNGWGTMKATMPDKLKIFKFFNQPFIDQIVSAEHDERDVDDIKGRGNDPEVIDHSLDEHRYGTMSIYKPEKKKESDQPDWFNDLMVQDEQKQAYRIGDP